jgi:hypothetical protein
VHREKNLSSQRPLFSRTGVARRTHSIMRCIRDSISLVHSGASLSLSHTHRGYSRQRRPSKRVRIVRILSREHNASLNTKPHASDRLLRNWIQFMYFSSCRLFARHFAARTARADGERTRVSRK